MIKASKTEKYGICIGGKMTRTELKIQTSKGMNKTKNNQDDSKDLLQLDKRNNKDTQPNNENGFVKSYKVYKNIHRQKIVIMKSKETEGQIVLC